MDLIQVKVQKVPLDEWKYEDPGESMLLPLGAVITSLHQLTKTGEACDLLVTNPIYTEVSKIFIWYLYCYRKEGGEILPDGYQWEPQERI